MQYDIKNSSKAIVKAKTFQLIATSAEIAVDPHNIFQDKIHGYGLMDEQRKRWKHSIKERFLSKESAEVKRAWKEFGAYNGIGD